ncbi:MAG: hypothetical protein Q4F07_06460 [Bacteroidales bacterium]|nr:hypothetical protein [Bacteroidales bacterium]
MEKYLCRRAVYVLMSVAFWLYVTIAFVAEEFFPALMPAVVPVRSVVSLAVGALGIVLLRRGADIMAVVTFAVIVAVSAIVNGNSLTFTLNGVRGYIAVLLVMPVLRWQLAVPEASRRRLMAGIDRQLVAYLAVQAVCVTWQFVRYGANDHGGGSWGMGGTGVVTVSIYLVSFWLMTRRWDVSRTYLSNLWHNAWLVLLLFPTMLNETKVGLVILPLYFLLLIPFGRHYARRMLVAVPVLAVCVMGAGALYLHTIDRDFGTIFSGRNINEYFFGGEDPQAMIANRKAYLANPDSVPYSDWNCDLPRFVKMEQIPDMLDDTGGGIALGTGVGHLRKSAVMDSSDFARRYEWVIGGTLPFIFMVMVELGTVGVIWLLGVLAVWLWPGGAARGTHMLNLRILWACVAVILLFYNEAFKIVPFMMLFLYPLVVGAQGYKAEKDL